MKITTCSIEESFEQAASGTGGPDETEIPPQPAKSAKTAAAPNLSKSRRVTLSLVTGNLMHAAAECLHCSVVLESDPMTIYLFANAEMIRLASQKTQVLHCVF